MTPATSSYVDTKEQRRRRDLIHLNLVRSPAANYVLVYLKAAGAEMPTTLVNGGQYMAKRGRRRMTSFDRREEAFEAKFAHDEERAFKGRARALRMLGLWAAGKRGEMGMAAEDYARALIDADISAVPDAAFMALTLRKSDKSATSSSLSRNATRHDAAAGLPLKGVPMNVSDIMRRTFATIKPDAPLMDAAHLLLETNQRGLPVIDREGTLVGVVSEGDFLHRAELDISPPSGNWLEELLGIEEDTPARRRMRARLVGEVMTRDPVCVDDEASLDEVVALMDARHIAQLPVVCGGSVVGVVSRVELLAAVANALGSVAQES
jgi:CBS domain-containing protein